MIDLHTHSTESDGSCTPERLVMLAAERGLSAIALTDHDTLSGIEAASRRARETGIRFIPGIEIQIDADRGEFHLLGLGLDGNRGGLENALTAVRLSRDRRNRRMIDKFQAAGIPISLEEVGRIALGNIVSRAHFARLLVSKKLASSTDQAFTRFLGKDKPFYEKRECLPLSDAVSLIRSAGGFAVIAHPLSLELRGPAFRQFLSRCLDLGVSGIEAYHPNHSLRECRKLERLGRNMGLLITGGSDFHGENVPHRRLGCATGGMEIPDALLDPLPLRSAAS
jgi:predicted metal-dependent phosphoesterase TrpH